MSLANFRDLDYQLVSPIEVPAGKVVGMRNRCGTAGPPLTGTANTCLTWVLILGGNRTALAAG